MNLAKVFNVAKAMAPELRYTIMHWATYVGLPKNRSDDMLDRVVYLFGSNKKEGVFSATLHMW